MASTIDRGNFLSRETVGRVHDGGGRGESKKKKKKKKNHLSIPTLLILPAWHNHPAAAGPRLQPLAHAPYRPGRRDGVGTPPHAAIIVFGKLNPIIVTLGTNFAGAAILGIYVQNAVVPVHFCLSTWGKEYS